MKLSNISKMKSGKRLGSVILAGTMALSAFACSEASAASLNTRPALVEKDIFEDIGDWCVDRGEDIAGAASAAGDWFCNRGEDITWAAGVTGDWFAARGEDIAWAADVTGDWFAARGEDTLYGFCVAGEWLGDRGSDVANIANGAVVWIGDQYMIAKEDSLAYLIVSGQKLLLGPYSELDDTGLSLVMNLAASLVNVDVGLDIRDFVYDMSNLKSEDVTVASIALDAAALLPIIGALKTLKHVDTVADAAKITFDGVDAASDIAKISDDTADAIDLASDTAKAADKIDDAADAAKDAEKIADNVVDAGDLSDDVHDASKATTDVTESIVDVTEAVAKKSPVSELPQDVQKRLMMYNEDGWKGLLDDAEEGMKAGVVWENKDLDLPTVDKLGNKITYREYYVFNPRPEPIGKGPERFVVSNSGVIYFTDDHYLTFTMITDILARFADGQ